MLGTPGRVVAGIAEQPRVIEQVSPVEEAIVNAK
jgi:hypothetical protein